MNKTQSLMILLLTLLPSTAAPMEKNNTDISNIPIDTLALLLKQHLAVLKAAQAPLSPRTEERCTSALASLESQSKSDPELEEKRRELFSAFMSLFNSCAKPCPRCQEIKEKNREPELNKYTERMVENALKARAAGEDPAGGASKEEFKNFDALRYVEIWTARKNMPVLPWRLKELVAAKTQER